MERVIKYVMTDIGCVVKMYEAGGVLHVIVTSGGKILAIKRYLTYNRADEAFARALEDSSI